MTTELQATTITPETCSVCNKEITGTEGFTSSTGVTVCGAECKEKYTKEKKRQPTLTVYSRVTGYCTPVSSWNAGKQKEFLDRHKYTVQK